MEITFDKDYLKQLYEDGKTDDKNHRFQPAVIQKYRKTIDLMQSLSAFEDFYRFNSLNYKILEGDMKGISSVRVNDKYRIEFTVEEIRDDIVITVCNILELSNHYK